MKPPSSGRHLRNADPETIRDFGEEWEYYNQQELSEQELDEAFNRYFSIFPWESLPADSVGFDLGCGSGRWATRIASRVGHLHCIDASERAIEVARRSLKGEPNCSFHVASVDEIPLPDGSADFGYSLGVLHHVPDTQWAIRSCVEKLKPGAPFLLYLYYSLENRPSWFRGLWTVSDLIRRVLSRLPSRVKIPATQAIALLVYLPFARVSRALEKAGMNVGGIPLSFYRHHSFYTMRTDALDRFGTRLEHRFSAPEIRRMMEFAGLGDVRFSESEPFWCAVGFRVEDGDG